MWIQSQQAHWPRWAHSSHAHRSTGDLVPPTGSSPTEFSTWTLPPNGWGQHSIDPLEQPYILVVRLFTHHPNRIPDRQTEVCIFYVILYLVNTIDWLIPDEWMAPTYSLPYSKFLAKDFPLFQVCQPVFPVDRSSSWWRLTTLPASVTLLVIVEANSPCETAPSVSRQWTTLEPRWSRQSGRTSVSIPSVVQWDAKEQKQAQGHRLMEASIREEWTVCSF